MTVELFGRKNWKSINSAVMNSFTRNSVANSALMGQTQYNIQKIGETGERLSQGQSGVNPPKLEWVWREAENDYGFMVSNLARSRVVCDNKFIDLYDGSNSIFLKFGDGEIVDMPDIQIGLVICVYFVGADVKRYYYPMSLPDWEVLRTTGASTKIPDVSMTRLVQFAWIPVWISKSGAIYTGIQTTPYSDNPYPINFYCNGIL